jgi:DNA-binding transcriptional ArsR family regulator
MPDSEEEIYSTMFSSLKHPARRKILRMLSEKSLTFSQMLEELGVSSSHLTYHLESLGELVVKMDDGKYRLSTYGEAAVLTMKGVEETPSIKTKYLLSFPVKWKAAFTVLMVSVILLASVSCIQYASLNQLTGEQELLKTNLDKLTAENQQLLSWSTSADKAVTVLRDVIQLDLTKYKATLTSDTIERRSDLGGVVEEILKYSLTSDESQIDVVIRFRNKNLSRYQLLVDESAPLYVQPQTSILDATKKLLERYSAYSDAPYLEEMSSLFASVNETKNTELTEGNTKMEISVSGDTTEIQWLYTENGVDFSPKSLSLTFEDNVLKELIDGWFLFKIGSTTVNISSAEAIEIARNYAKNFSWNAEGVEVSSFAILQDPVSVLFHPTAREDPLTLVPYWYVTLSLDKVYPPGVNKIAVGVWADTGKVAQAKTLSG